MEEDYFLLNPSAAAYPALLDAKLVDRYEAAQPGTSKEPFKPFPPECEGFTTKNASDIYNDPWQKDRVELADLYKTHLPEYLRKLGVSSLDELVSRDEQEKASKKPPTPEWDPEFSFDDLFEYYQNLPDPKSPSDPIIPPIAPPPHRAYLSVIPSDARSKPPMGKADRVALRRALFHTRHAFLHWTGQAAPKTDRTKSYAYQYHQLGEQFHILWLTMNPGRDTPCLFCLPKWEGGISDWQEPVQDKRYLAPYTYACTEHYPNWPHFA